VTRLRIAIDATVFDTRSSGIGWHVHHLVRALGALGSEHRITVLHTRGGRALRDGAPAGLRFVELRAPIRWLRLVWRTTGLPPAQAFAGGIDVIHCPFFLPCPALRAPYTLTIHDLAHVLFPELAHPTTRRVLGRWLPAAARRAAAVVVDSAAVGEQVVEHLRLDPDRVRVVRNAVDPAYAAAGAAGPCPADSLARLGVRPPYLLFVGTLEPRKDLTTLVDAFARLRARGARHRLVLAGAPGHGSDAVRAAARRHRVENEIDWLGWVAPDLLRDLYRGADAFVFPSVCEGFGFPPLEALACGTPVVASSAQCLPEILGDAAAYAAPRDPAELAAQIEQVLSDPALCDALRGRGLARARERSWDAVARETLGVLEEAARRGPPR
jgi:glycosyltransferase involved in cell wall biosynthesis